jgi:hypothetical protein
VTHRQRFTLDIAQLEKHIHSHVSLQRKMRLAAQAKFASPLDREAWFAGYKRTALIRIPNS